MRGIPIIFDVKVDNSQKHTPMRKLIAQYPRRNSHVEIPECEEKTTIWDRIGLPNVNQLRENLYLQTLTTRAHRKNKHIELN